MRKPPDPIEIIALDKALRPEKKSATLAKICKFRG